MNATPLSRRALAPGSLQLAVVGASVRAAAQSALRAGFRVVAADMFGDADLSRDVPTTRVLNYPQDLLDWLGQTECDAWFFTGAIENHCDLVDELAKLRSLWGNDADRLRRVRDPFMLQRELAVSGIAFPETLHGADARLDDGVWLAKTYRGASGAGVWRIDDEGAQNRVKANHAVLQRFIDGISIAATLVVGRQATQLFGVTRQLVGDEGHPFRYNGSIGPLSVEPPIVEQLQRLGEVLRNRFDLRGLVGVDLILADGVAWVVEVNPRYTASVEILERALEISAIQAHVAACQGSELEQLRLAPSPRDASHAAIHGKRILYAPSDATVSPEFHAWAMERAPLDVRRQLLADIPAAGETIRAGQPVLTMFAAAASHSDCEERLSERRREVLRRLSGGP